MLALALQGSGILVWQLHLHKAIIHLGEGASLEPCVLQTWTYCMSLLNEKLLTATKYSLKQSILGMRPKVMPSLKVEMFLHRLGSILLYITLNFWKLESHNWALQPQSAAGSDIKRQKLPSLSESNDFLVYQTIPH